MRLILLGAIMAFASGCTIRRTPAPPRVRAPDADPKHDGAHAGKRPGSTLQISLGRAHTCAVDKQGGGVRCWGDNRRGQLGDGTREPRLAPTLVKGLPAADQIAAEGFNHTCALTKRGEVYCWGGNDSGQLGTGDVEPRLSPTLVPALGEVQQLAVAGATSCALTRSGGLWCWGDLGESRSLVAMPLHADVTLAEIALAASQKLCARTRGGDVRCWGWDASRRRQYEVRVESVRELSQLTVDSAEGCALQRSGRAVCWSVDPPAERAGDGPGADVVTRRSIAVEGLIGGQWLSLGPSPGTRCAVLESGRVWCNAAAQPPSGLEGVVAVQYGSGRGCVVQIGDVLRCWGRSDYGQAGNGVNLFEAAASVPTVQGATSVSVGRDHACALLADGTIWCWGDVSPERPASASPTATSPLPRRIGIGGAIAIVSYYDEACAATKDSGVKCWGGVFGTSAPQAIPGLARSVDVAIRGGYAGNYGAWGRDAGTLFEGHVCGRRADGRTLCALFQFTSQSRAVSHRPFQVFAGARQIAAGGELCAPLESGALACWDGIPITRDRIPELASVVGLGVGDTESCAVLADKSIRCWNWVLPVPHVYMDESLTPITLPCAGCPAENGRPEPDAVTGIDHATGVTVGSETCALLDDGRVRCWVQNEAPGLLIDNLTDAVQVVAGPSHKMCALLRDGTIRCWAKREKPEVTRPAIVPWPRLTAAQPSQDPVSH
jgi:hypothetical protein